MDKHDPNILPPNLPIPQDDGAWDHLSRPPFNHLPPEIGLASTDGTRIRLSDLGNAVIFAYPRTGVPGQPPSKGFAGEEWESIPGARGCTPQSCGFRDLAAEFAALGYRVFGLSTNTTEHQREFKQRNQIPFEFLSDSDLKLTNALALPTFEFPTESGGPTTLLRRMAMVLHTADRGSPRIEKVFAPVIPPQENARTVLAWLRSRAEREARVERARRDRVNALTSRITVRAMTDADRPLMAEQFTHHFGSVHINSRRQWIDTRELPGLIAELTTDDGKRRIAGLCVHTPTRAGEDCELVALVSLIESVGVGTRLLDACAAAAKAAGCGRIFLTTSNDNIHALSLYQRRGWRLAALYPGSLAEARVAKTGMPTHGPSGIEMRDDLELEITFTQ